MRVLEWIHRRAAGDVEAVDTPLGRQPRAEDLNLAGLDMTPTQFKELMSVRREEWLDDLESQYQFLSSLGPKLPAEIWAEHEYLKKRLAQ
jgi:phosphoenolpyruvate carboxykinase (GTP)